MKTTSRCCRFSSLIRRSPTDNKSSCTIPLQELARLWSKHDGSGVFFLYCKWSGAVWAPRGQVHELDPYACSKMSDYMVDEFSEYPSDTPTAKLKGLVEPSLFKINIQRKEEAVWYSWNVRLWIWVSQCAADFIIEIWCRVFRVAIGGTRCTELSWSMLRLSRVATLFCVRLLVLQVCVARVESLHTPRKDLDYEIRYKIAGHFKARSLKFFFCSVLPACAEPIARRQVPLKCSLGIGMGWAILCRISFTPSARSSIRQPADWRCSLVQLLHSLYWHIRI